MDILNSFTIPSSQISSNDLFPNEEINKKNQPEIIKYLDYFKQITGIALMPELIQEYTTYLDNQRINKQTPEEQVLLKVKEIHLLSDINFEWDSKLFGFRIPLFDPALDYKNFYTLITDKLFYFLKSSKLLKKQLTFYANDKYEVFDFNKKNTTPINLLDIESLKPFANTFNFENLNQNNFSNINLDIPIDIILKALSELLSLMNNLKQIKLAITGMDFTGISQFIGLSIEPFIQDYIQEIRNFFTSIQYMSLGIFKDIKSNSYPSLTKKSIPFTIKVELDFSTIVDSFILLKPLDILKISMSNISVSSVNEDTELILNENFNFSEEQHLTVDLIEWEKHLQEKNLHTEDIFYSNNLYDKHKWNYLLNSTQKFFNFDINKAIIENSLLFFEPSEEIKSLYDSYELAIETIFRSDNYTKQRLKNSLLYKLMNLKNISSIENIHFQKEEILLSAYDSLGFLKENIISTHESFDYFGLNINQRIFSNKYLHCFSDNISDSVTNIIALNGPPGTGKTTVLQTAVATDVVQNTLFEKGLNIIFGCSATRQAKNNIIGGFQHDAIHDENYSNTIIYSRWIKNILRDTSEDGNVNLILQNLDYGLSLEKPDTITSFLKSFFENKDDLRKNYNDLFNQAKQLPNVLNKNQVEALNVLNVFFNKKINTSYCFSQVNNSILSLLKNIYDNYLEIETTRVNFIKKIKTNLNNYQVTPKLKFDENLYLKINESLNTNNIAIQSINENIKTIKSRKEALKDSKKIELSWRFLLKKIDSILKIKSFSKQQEELFAFLDEIKQNQLFILFDLHSFLDTMFEHLIENFDNIYNYSFDSIKNEIFQIGDVDLSTIMEQLTHLKKEELFLIQQKKELEEERNIFLEYKPIIENNSTIINLIKPYILLLLKNTSNYKITNDRLKNLYDFITGSIDETNISILNDIVEHIDDILKTLIDNTFKPAMFHLSMRYQEKTFIDELFTIDNKFFTKQSYIDIQAKYKLASKITPIFVSTMHALSRRIQHFSQKDKSSLAFIDLLIVDEAGQVSPEVGAISLLLAKKALIVGDCYQIEPVYNVSKNLDLNLFKSKFDLNELKEDEFELNIWNCHSSSIMKIAQKSSIWHQYDDLEKGLYLVEHNRCPIEIISFCDELIYKNKLKYSITSYYEKNNEPLYESHITSSLKKASYNLIRNKKLNSSNLHIITQKPWVFIENDYECDGGTTLNRKEIDDILKWLDENYNYLKTNYPNKKLNEIIAIITPFKRQAFEIINKGKKYLFKNSELNSLKESLFYVPNKKDKVINTEKITIGTVHSLQGAEIPIVLFSNVYGFGSNVTSPFIDRQPSIINVGVSRAKQSIYVFGNEKFFKRIHEASQKSGQQSATALMYEYLLKYR
jgi:hypothetical protein